MTDETPGTSGNRWEPTDAPTDLLSEPTAQAPAAEAPPAEAPATRPWLTTARTAVAGGAAAVLIAGGLGGFAIGRATADSDGAGGTDQQQGRPAGFDRDQDGDGPGFDGGRPPGGPDVGQLPEGQQPGAPSDDDADGSDT
jgi:hypothetical protein